MPNVTPQRTPAVAAPAFVGRAADLTELTGKLAGESAVVIIEGEAGIGKTRLITEYLAASKQNALVATCPSFRTPQTLSPLTDALRHATPAVAHLKLTALAGALRPLFPEWAADLPGELGPAEDNTAARHLLFRALHELIRVQGISLIVLDDAHWADDATLEFLLFLAAGERQRIVVTARPEDTPETSLLPRLARRAAGWITLRALDVAGTAAMVASMLDGDVSEEFARFAHEHAGGLPVAVDELVRLLAARADIRLRNGRWVRRELPGVVVPPRIRGSVLERAARLGEDARAVLAAVAVAGEPVSEPAVAAICELDTERVVAGLSESLTSGLLAEAGNGLIWFRHALAALAVYESVPGPRRRLEHRRAAKALKLLTPPPSATALARHFRAAGAPEGWRRYAEQAAELAMRAGDQAGAAAVLYELVTRQRWPARTLAELASKIVLLALPGDAELSELAKVLRGALHAAALSPADAAELRFQLGRVLAASHETDASHAELARAAAELPGESFHSVRAMMLLSWPDDTSSPADEHLRWLRRAAEASPEAIPPEERLRIRVDRVTALLLLGEESGWSEAADIPWLPVTPQDTPQVIRAHANIGETALLWGRYAEARRRLEHSAALAEQHAYPRLRVEVMVALARLDWLTGKWDGLAERAEDLTAGEDVPVAQGLSAVLVGTLLHAAQGEANVTRLAQAIKNSSGCGSVSSLIESAAELARLEQAAGNVPAALAITEDPLDIVVRKRTWLWAAELVPVRVAALVAARRVGEAVELTGAFAAGISGRRAPSAIAGLTLSQAILAVADGDPGRGERLFMHAAELFTSLPRPYAALLAAEQRARCLLACGKHLAGLRTLTAAAAGLHRLGARGDVARVVHVLREHGGRWRAPGCGGRPGYGNELSPREVEVVALVAGGLTNRQIADALAVSRQTVASHVHSALGKLGVSTRTSLAVTAREVGIISDEKTLGRTRRLNQPVDH